VRNPHYLAKNEVFQVVCERFASNGVGVGQERLNKGLEVLSEWIWSKKVRKIEKYRKN